MSSPDITQVVGELEEIVKRSLSYAGGLDPDRAQTPAAYASYKSIDLVAVRLHEANKINADSPAHALAELR